MSIIAQTSPEGADLQITSLKFYKPISTAHSLHVDFDFVVVYNHEPSLKVIFFSNFVQNTCFGYKNTILGMGQLCSVVDLILDQWLSYSSAMPFDPRKLTVRHVHIQHDLDHFTPACF